MIAVHEPNGGVWPRQSPVADVTEQSARLPKADRLALKVTAVATGVAAIDPSIQKGSNLEMESIRAGNFLIPHVGSPRSRAV